MSIDFIISPVVKVGVTLNYMSLRKLHWQLQRFTLKLFFPFQIRLLQSIKIRCCQIFSMWIYCLQYRKSLEIFVQISFAQDFDYNYHPSL